MVLLHNKGILQDLFSIDKSLRNKHWIIDNFCFDLQHRYPMFQPSIHAKLKAMLLKLKGNLALGDACNIKTNKGLGPLAMLAELP